jgi:hypothetical protein
MPKWVHNKMVSTHALIEQVPDDNETSITVPDVYKTYSSQQNCSNVFNLWKDALILYEINSGN